MGRKKPQKKAAPLPPPAPAGWRARLPGLREGGHGPRLRAIRVRVPASGKDVDALVERIAQRLPPERISDAIDRALGAHERQVARTAAAQERGRAGLQRRLDAVRLVAEGVRGLDVRALAAARRKKDARSGKTEAPVKKPPRKAAPAAESKTGTRKKPAAKGKRGTRS